MNAVVASDPPARPTAEAITRQLVDLCLRAIRRFGEWERAELLLKTPTTSLLEEHAKTSAWLIRLLAQLHAAASDPDYPDPAAARELNAVLWQLRQVHDTLHHPMPEAEADRLLNTVFPGNGRGA